MQAHGAIADLFVEGSVSLLLSYSGHEQALHGRKGRLLQEQRDTVPDSCVDWCFDGLAIVAYANKVLLNLGTDC